MKLCTSTWFVVICFIGISAVAMASQASIFSVTPEGFFVKKSDAPLVCALASIGFASYLEHVLVQEKCSPNVTYDGQSPLMIAALYGYVDCVKLLLAARADINWANEPKTNSGIVVGGVTAAYVAAQEGHADVLGLLLKNGADPTLRTTHGMTAMAIALCHGHAEVVEQLELATVSWNRKQLLLAVLDEEGNRG